MIGKRGVQRPDGNWVIDDVAVMYAHTIPLIKADGTPALDADGKPRTVDIDGDWLRQAVQQSRDRASGFAGAEDPYRSPIHINHTRDAKGNPQNYSRAGELELTDVRTVSYEGEPTEAAIGRMILDPETYADVEAGKLTYLSPEVHDVRRPEVDSLALMAETVPFFRAQLHITESVPFQGAAPRPRPTPSTSGPAWALDARGPILAYRSLGDHGRALLTHLHYCDEPKTMDTDDKPKLSLTAEQAAGIGDAISASLMAMVESGGDGPGGDRLDLDDDPTAPMPPASGGDVPPGPGEMPPPEDDDPKNVAYAARYAALQQRQAKLDARVAAMEQGDARRRRAATASEELRTAGFDVEALRPQIIQYSASAASLKTYVDTLKAHVEPTPASGASLDTVGLRAAAQPTSAWPTELQFCAKLSPAHQAQAREYAAEYSAFSAAGHPPTCPLDEYVRLSLGPLGQ